MIAEPYICIRGLNAGFITWAYEVSKHAAFRPYADFEREKLKALGDTKIEVTWSGYQIAKGNGNYYAFNVTGYRGYDIDSESFRLLARARFLKAVCEKEGVEWLPREVEKGELQRRAQKVTRQVNDIAKELLGEKCEIHTFTKKGSCACDEEGPCKAHGQDVEGSYQPCTICGERITSEKESVAGWHFKCSKPDTYTKAEIDERLGSLLELMGEALWPVLCTKRQTWGRVETMLKDLRRRFLDRQC